MWARVKGKAENALLRLPLRGVYNMRPGLMKPVPGQKNVKRSYRILLLLYPLMSLFFPGLTLNQVGRAMIRCVREGRGQTSARARGHRGAVRLRRGQRITLDPFSDSSVVAMRAYCPPHGVNCP